MYIKVGLGFVSRWGRLAHSRLKRHGVSCARHGAAGPHSEGRLRRAPLPGGGIQADATAPPAGAPSGWKAALWRWRWRWLGDACFRTGRRRAPPQPPAGQQSQSWRRARSAAGAGEGGGAGLVTTQHGSGGRNAYVSLLRLPQPAGGHQPGPRQARGARTSISAAGVKGPNGLRSVEDSMGMREAVAKVMAASTTPAASRGRKWRAIREAGRPGRAGGGPGTANNRAAGHAAASSVRCSCQELSCYKVCQPVN